jgi:hypothetical protein
VDGVGGYLGMVWLANPFSLGNNFGSDRVKMVYGVDGWDTHDQKCCCRSF